MRISVRPQGPTPGRARQRQSTGGHRLGHRGAAHRNAVSRGDGARCVAASTVRAGAALSMASGHGSATCARRRCVVPRSCRRRLRTAATLAPATRRRERGSGCEHRRHRMREANPRSAPTASKVEAR